jgi:hypothetical protein
MDTAVKEPATVGQILDNLPTPPTSAPWMNPGTSLLQIAIDRGADLPTLERLMDLRDRWEATEARKAYVAALAAFKANPPTIVKNKRAGFDGKSGGRTEYGFATLDQVAAVIGAALSKHGLSAAWRTAQADGRIKVTCELRHALGHSEETSLEAGADTSGSKNNIQAIGSTVTYLSRYTLLAITGLAAGDEDDDAKTGGAGDFISAEQKATLVEMMREAEPDLDKLAARTTRFLKFFKLESLDDLPGARFGEAKDILQQQINAASNHGAHA